MSVAVFSSALYAVPSVGEMLDPHNRMSLILEKIDYGSGDH